MHAAARQPRARYQPDEIARGLRETIPGIDARTANLRAAETSDAQLDACIADGVSVLVETVLSSEKFKPRVVRALAKGFRFDFTFVVLSEPSLSVARVSQRVAMGGHDVPEQAIHDRWHRSIANLRWFAEHADVAHVFDNSEIGKPVLLAEKREDVWLHLVPDRIPAVAAALAGL